jgi:tyrosyl-tRNA synthetase
VDKMSKSKGNYIGITEPPKVIFRKVMGISDTLMWRYWELLTDRSLAEIAAMKAEEPMEVKMRLARQIVSDFHSSAAADQAQADFDREVRDGAAPTDIETIEVPDFAIVDAPRDAGVHEMRPLNAPAEKIVNVDKLVAAIGLAESVTDAARKRKAGAVRIDENEPTEAWSKLFLNLLVGRIYYVRVGKKWKRVRVS